MLTPQQIQDISFEKALFGGYDMDSVDDILEPLTEDYVTLYKENSVLKSKMRILVEKLEEYPLPEAEAAEAMVRHGAETARALGMRPYYMYRQKYMRGNLENVGYALPGLECVYNIDMMEDTTSIMAHGAGAMTKCVYDAERRVERVPNPKNIETYIAKVDRLAEEKRRLYEMG